MKLFVGILTIYFLALSIMPCTDGESHTEPNTTEMSHNHSDNNSGHQDDCTPLCICACCGTVVVLPLVFNLDMSKADLSATFQFHYSFDYSFNFNEGVWRPPANC